MSSGPNKAEDIGAGVILGVITVTVITGNYLVITPPIFSYFRPFG